ncbi:MAG: 3-isopropylmalate dehydratase [Treponema sp. GWB1_62_6]|nr:MAG: 3-isopropylmalate dehydratase [Treponema sp. GWC1_61_84]OHE68559.1 MAG: 3-isopropylmalate dehydratase [Treponema sp. GWB1_62_6]HCM26202.1 3-isopropylmalate dehydratase small subunit [Treponema sp.]
MKQFGGKVLFLDRSDINTDEIIPAKYLTEISKEALKPNLLEDLKLPSFDARRDVAGKAAVLTRANFGCGSSREHAPWALEVNGINLAIAESFARIFRQNMYNCGMIAAELPKAILDGLFSDFAGKETGVAVDLENLTLTFSAPDATARSVAFALSDFERALVEAGGWVEFAAKKY